LRPGGQGAPVLSGPRIIRRPGESPLLTNLSGSQLDARQADVGQAAADILRSGIAKGNFQSISNADDISGGGLRSRVAGGGTGETSDSPTIADLLSTTSDINLGGLQAAGALSTDLFNRREKGIRNRQKDRELGVQEVNAAGSLAKTNAEVNKIQTELKGGGLEALEFEPVFTEQLIDPSQPFLGVEKKLTSFATSGKGGIPSNIPISDVDTFRQAMANAPDQTTKDRITALFKARYLEGTR